MNNLLRENQLIFAEVQSIAFPEPQNSTQRVFVPKKLLPRGLPPLENEAVHFALVRISEEGTKSAYSLTRVKFFVDSKTFNRRIRRLCVRNEKIVQCFKEKHENDIILVTEQGQGQVVFDTATQAFHVYNGSQWIRLY